MDTSLFRSINRLADHTVWAHGFMKLYADYGLVLYALAILGVYVAARRQGDGRMLAGAVWAGAAGLVALGAAQLVGGIVDRARPYEALANVHVLVDKTTDFSFPSDHATVVGAVAVGLWLVHRRLGMILAVVAVGMAFARVYVGRHYPGDVLGGLVLGGAVAYVGGRLLLPLLTSLAARLERTPLRPLLTAARAADMPAPSV